MQLQVATHTIPTYSTNTLQFYLWVIVNNFSLTQRQASQHNLLTTDMSLFCSARSNIRLSYLDVSMSYLAAPSQLILQLGF